jgi:hypothetical protein
VTSASRRSQILHRSAIEARHEQPAKIPMGECLRMPRLAPRSKCRVTVRSSILRSGSLYMNSSSSCKAQVCKGSYSRCPAHILHLPIMSTQDSIPSIIKETRDSASYTPAEAKEPRQVTTTDDMHPDPSKSIKLPPNRQALLDDVIALYSCQPTIQRVSRYAPNCVSGMPTYSRCIELKPCCFAMSRFTMISKFADRYELRF